MVDAYSFGRIIVNGIHYSHDIKIIRDSVIPEWWRRSGHRVASDDISDVLDSKTDIIILGTGNPGLMKADNELKSLLKLKKIELIEVPTAEAVSLYNQLINEGKNIAAGFHLTC